MLNVQGLPQNASITAFLPDGDSGTSETIKYARQLIEEGLRDAQIREAAVGFCRQYGAAPHDELAELQAVYTGVLNNFDFRKHTVGAQLLQPVRGILRTQAGDCADLNLILLASLVGSIGYPSKAVTIKADSQRPEDYSHVYIEAQLSDGQWIPLDVARQNPRFGASPEYYWQREEYPLTPGVTHMAGYSANPQLVSWGAFPKFGNGPRAAGVNWRPAIRRGVGDDSGGFNASQFTAAALAAAPAILQSTAQLVKASNTPGIPSPAVGYPSGSVATGGAGSSTWIIVLSLGVLAAVLISKKG